MNCSSKHCDDEASSEIIPPPVYQKDTSGRWNKKVASHIRNATQTSAGLLGTVLGLTRLSDYPPGELNGLLTALQKFTVRDEVQDKARDEARDKAASDLCLAYATVLEDN